MTSPPASLLRNLLTRSDFDRMEVAEAQVEQWLQQGALAALAQTSPALADEPVFAVPDEALQAELAERLRPLGKPDVLLSPARIQAFLQRAMADDQAETAVVTTLAELAPPAADGAAQAPGASEPADDLDHMFEITADGPPATTTAREPADPRDAEIEALMSPAPSRPKTSPNTDWFDIGELEAAMGELLPMTETGAAPASSFEVPPAAPPAVDVAEDLYALTEMVHGHGQQLEQLGEIVEALGERLQQLEDALVDAGVVVVGEEEPHAEPATTAAAAEEPAPQDHRRTAVLAIACALSGWSALMWFGTGSATLSLLSLVAAAVMVALALRSPRPAG